MTACASLAFFRVQRWDRLTLTAEVDCQQSLVVMPDQIRVNGNLVTLTGKCSDGQREIVNWRCRTKKEQQWWLHIRQPLQLTAWGQLQPVTLATNFAQFDLRTYYRERGICNQLRARQLAVRPRAVLGPLDLCHCLRAWLHGYFRILPKPLSQYCDRLLIGFSTPNEDWQQAVRQLGIIHLFCISGMHVVLAIELLRRLLTRLYVTKESIDWLLVLFLPAYLIIGGGAVSLVRAVIMAECHLLGRHFKLTGIDIWSLSLILGLVHDPLLLMSMGGQLSYLLSLMLYYVKEGGWQQSVQLSLLSLPAILHGAFEFHILSLFASYIAIPVFAVLIFPGTIIAALTYRWWPCFGDSFNWALLQFHHCLIALAHLPGEICFGRPSGPLTILLLVLTLLVVDSPASRKRWLALLSAYLLIFVSIHVPLNGEITFVDIGQGDSIIIRTPLNRKVIMIDTGGRLSFRQGRWARVKAGRSRAETCSINYLKSEGINHLDALCLSHADADHIGDMSSVMRDLKVSKVVVPIGMESLPQFTGRLVGTTEVVPCKAGDNVDRILRAVHPAKPGQGKNEDSLTLWGIFGGNNFLFTGDLDRAGEKAVIQRYPQLSVDVLKLGHHGSKTATDPEAIRHWQPRLAIISAGRFNRYGHPNRETMQILHDDRIPSMSTQQYGMISYQYRGEHGQWKTCLRGDELKWMLPPYSNS